MVANFLLHSAHELNEKMLQKNPHNDLLRKT